MRTAGGWRGAWASWLVLVACASDDVGTTTAASTSTSTLEGTTASGSASESGSSTTAGATLTSGSTTLEPTGGSSTGPGDGTTSTADSTGTHGDTTGPALSPCEAGCAVEVVCTDDWRSVLACVDACEANLVAAAEFQRACRAAWEDLHACLGTLTCEELAQWMDPTRFPYPCLREDEVLGFECAGQ